MNVGIFMNLKFRKYSHGGSYSEEELLLPDNTTLSTINIIYSSYRVYKKGDTEEWTNDYIITCEFSKEVKARLEESYAEILFYTDNTIVAILSEVHITSNFETIPLSNLNNILDGLFFEFQEDNDTELSKLYRECDIETYVKEANTYLNIVMEILRPMKFTENGILMSSVSFYTSFYFKDFPKIEIDTLPYKALRRLKISKKENIKEIYQERVNKIYGEVSLIDSYTQTN